MEEVNFIWASVIQPDVTTLAMLKDYLIELLRRKDTLKIYGKWVDILDVPQQNSF